jgi:hypothetical protein
MLTEMTGKLEELNDPLNHPKDISIDVHGCN